MFSNAAYLAFLAYVVISPFVAAAALGSDSAFRVVSALNFGLTVGWALGTGSLKIEIGFPSAAKPITVPTDFSVDALKRGYFAASASPFASRCADPATCGSEFEADSLTSRAVTCSRCGLQGELDADCAAELVPGAVIEAPAGKAAPMARSTADIKTAFSVEGVAGVEAASRG